MNDFEKLLHGILDTTNSFWNARYIGRACYAPVTEDLRIKAELHSTLVSEHYNSLKLTAISNKNGVIDSLTLHFADYLSVDPKIRISNTRPYIWSNKGSTEWFGTPKPQELFALAQAADEYAIQFDPEQVMRLDPDMEMG